MVIKFWILAAISLHVVFAQLHDLTRTPDATGPEVVAAVTDILSKSCVFPDDLLYLRRLAYVQSRDGADLNSTNFDGGIWRVDQKTFNETKYALSLSALRTNLNKLFFVDWSRISWSDLRMPFYSGIAAEMAAILRAGSAGIPNTVETQAAFWGGSARANVFVKLIDQLNKMRVYFQDVDIVFVLDSSASLAPSDFDKAKEFTSKVLEGLDVGGGKVRAGVVEYSTIVYPQISLNNGLSEFDLLQAIAKIPYQPGGTNTHLALNYVLNNTMQVAEGARANSVKIVVIVTDGRSDDRVATVENAEKLKAAGVNVFTVGVGDSIDKQELTRVASSPACVHVKTVSNYTDLPAINFEIQQQSLKSSVLLGPGTYTFGCGSQVKTLILPSLGGKTTVEISTTDGKLWLFGAASNVFTPSSVLYSFNETVEPGVQVQIYVRDGSQIGLAFANATSGGCSTGFTVKVRNGDFINIGSRVVCVGGGISSACSTKDYDGSPFVITGTLDPSIPNICTNRDLFKAPYPGQTDRYLYCSSGNMIVIYCPQSFHFDILSASCKFGVLTTTTVAKTTPLVTTLAPVTPTRATAPAATQPAATLPPATLAPVTPTQQVVASSFNPLYNPCTPDAIAKQEYVFAYPPDNKAFIKCGNFAYVGSVLYCPAHKFYDDSIKSCIYYEVIVNATQEVFTTFTNPCDKNHVGDVEYHPHPTDPHKFIQCDAFGEAYTKDCHNNEVWRQDILSCVVAAGLNFGTNGVGK